MSCEIAIGISTHGLDLHCPRMALAAESRKRLEHDASARFLDVQPARNARTVYGYRGTNPFLRDLLTSVRQEYPDAIWYGYVHTDIIFTTRFEDWVERSSQQGFRVLTACRLNGPEAPSLDEVEAVSWGHDKAETQRMGVELVLIHTTVFEPLFKVLPDVVVGIDSWGRAVREAARDHHHLHCHARSETPLRHIAHREHPGTHRTLVRRLNTLMANAIANKHEHKC
ncbi:MAG: hypothetical protein GC159_17735 [Phycisphaera sp.]|nr:hypothetical protein [Phycisphaera sp.]